jgi:hypothetical protein
VETHVFDLQELENIAAQRPQIFDRSGYGFCVPPGP